MKKRTVWITIIIILLAIIGFIFFFKKDNSTTPVPSDTAEEIVPDEPVETEPVEKEEEPVEEIIENEETVENIEPVADNTISDNWKDGEFLIDGVKITMPASLQDLEKAGWVLDIDRTEKYMWIVKDENGNIDEEASVKANYTIPAHGSYNSDNAFGNEAHLRNEAYPGAWILVFGIHNPTDTDLDIADCVCAEFYVANRADFNGLTLPQGITYGATKEEVIAAYGEPTESYESSMTSMIYDSDDTQVRLHLDFMDGVLENISFTCGGLY